MTQDTSDRKINTLISTNFNSFRKEDLQKLFDSELTVLEPCLDGFFQESYQKYRVKGNVDAVKNNIRLVMDYKLHHKKKWPFVDVQVVIFDHIKDEVPLIDRFLKECKVDKITYKADISSTNFVKEQTISRKSCFWLYIAMHVKPNGDVHPCCIRNTIPFGNIFVDSLEEIWNNKFYTYSRSLFSNNVSEANPDDELKQIPCLQCKHFRIKHQ